MATTLAAQAKTRGPRAWVEAENGSQLHCTVAVLAALWAAAPLRGGGAESAADEGFFRGVSTIAATIFACASLYLAASVSAFQPPAPERRNAAVTEMVAETAKSSDAALACAAAINAVACFAHVAMTAGAPARQTARWAERSATLPMLVFLLAVFEDAPGGEPKGASGETGNLVGDLKPKGRVAVWRGMAAMEAGMALVMAANVWGAQLPPRAGAAALALAAAILVRIVTHAARGAGDAGKPAPAGCAARPAHDRAAARSARCAALCAACAATAALTLLIVSGAALRLYSDRAETVALVVLEVASKALYGCMAAKSHARLLAPCVVLEQLLALEHCATEQRRGFLRYVMHEVRVPLNTVHLAVHAMNDVDAAQRRGLVADIARSVAVMSSTLDAVLSLAAIEEGRMDLDVAPFEVARLLRGAVDMFAQAAAHKRISLVVDDAGKVPDYAYGDGHKLASVVNNLVSNAIKFSNADSTIRLSMSARPADDAHRPAAPSGAASDDAAGAAGPAVLLRVSVADCGVGLAEADAARLFTPFTQIRPGELQGGRGSGLGLSIAKHVVELHGGTIGCASRAGIGSTFHFAVPLHAASDRDFREAAAFEPPLVAAPVAAAAAAYGSARGAGPATHRPASDDSPTAPAHASSSSAPPRRALVVDDVGVNRKLLGLLLAKQGYACVDAVDGGDALRAYRGARARGDDFELICMDSVMPVMDGLAAAAIIRAEGYAGLLVGCTGNALEDDILAFQKAGADAVFTKPIPVHKLVDLVRRRAATA
ncbi:hypothetical protein M885DRAFT_456717 [Pelagophyceae sp. CCMP2097]|nr:hypothetical protein M885DRAFT_456717 [Pelagophyceae sp. CCMP2097]